MLTFSKYDTNKIFEDNPIVFLDLAIGPEKVGRVIIELFKNIVPQTAENFRALCTGEKGVGTKAKKLHYKGSIFHKVVPQFMIQGGDIVNYNGTDGESIYGPYFDDESFVTKHKYSGLLSMVNEGKPNTNSSQFIITVQPSIHLDKTNVVFGKVIKGMDAVLEINKVATEKHVPLEKVSIIDCGELEKDANWELEENEESQDIYPSWPTDWIYPAHNLNYKYMEEVIMKIKDTGNDYFLKENFIDAGRKYKKALRYYHWMTKQQNMTDTFYASLENLKLILLLNLAAVKLKQKKHHEAIYFCEEVLKVDKTNHKALHRRAQAYESMNEYESALKDWEKVSEQYPNDNNLKLKIKKAKEKINSYLKNEKLTYKNMFREYIFYS
ncbi:peptidyl-prolyl cis-trans isomerase D [Linepithema humile]|uniref:peptidyl-prolyl cis-trans isomerase D n=1 Tax=Linepithema humile TaxID=83485 RepID=UPI000623AF03|nr:PREDICTED: peptidyl-prolyl cis-trans isomerase D [Linepithema humile]